MTNITEKEDLEIKEYEFLKRKVAHLKKQENKEEELENLDCFFREGIKRMELFELDRLVRYLENRAVKIRESNEDITYLILDYSFNDNKIYIQDKEHVRIGFLLSKKIFLEVPFEDIFHGIQGFVYTTKIFRLFYGDIKWKN